MKSCGDEEFSCTSLHQCIQKTKVCDGHVNCVDGSDEKDCSCISRLNPSQICDNYYDCPDGMDEIGCFGCENSFSCLLDEHEFNDNSRQPECYTDVQKCDRVRHCSNGNDEVNCLFLAPKTTSSPDPFVRSTNGILYRNLENKWYPVCTDRLNWTKQVCKLELGEQLR